MTETSASPSEVPEAPRREAQPALPGIVQIKPIPAVINTAISAITGAINPITKGAYNEYGKYNYASVDQIYELVAPQIAAHGLNIIPVEMADVMVVSGSDGKNWGKFVIGFVFTMGDVQYFDPHMRETLFIRIEGPQTFSGAKSYAQKSFLRHLFKIATGEPDLDALPPERDTEKGNGAKVAAKKAKSEPAKMTPEESAKFKISALNYIAGLKTPLSAEDRAAFAERFGAEAGRMTDVDAAAVRKAYADAARGKAT